MAAGCPLADPQGVDQRVERPLVAGQPFGDGLVRHRARRRVALAVAAIP